MDWIIYSLAIAGGFIAGFINTLAGNGSLITLPILIFLGLPANIANATNRLGILLQTLIGTITLKQKSTIEFKENYGLIVASVTGAIIGSNIAIEIDADMMRYTIGFVMLLMLYIVFIHPEKWMQTKQKNVGSQNKLISILVFFAIGVYGGFIQAGVGIFLLTALITVTNFNVHQSNVLKNFIVFCYTIPVFIIFIMNDQINWYLGSLIAVGQVSGSWVAAHFSNNFKDSELWIRRITITIILGSTIELFNLRNYLFSFIMKLL